MLRKRFVLPGKFKHKALKIFFPFCVTPFKLTTIYKSYYYYYFVFGKFSQIWNLLTLLKSNDFHSPGLYYFMKRNLFLKEGEFSKVDCTWTVNQSILRIGISVSHWTLNFRYLNIYGGLNNKLHLNWLTYFLSVLMSWFDSQETSSNWGSTFFL